MRTIILVTGVLIGMSIALAADTRTTTLYEIKEFEVIIRKALDSPNATIKFLKEDGDDLIPVTITCVEINERKNVN